MMKREQHPKSRQVLENAWKHYLDCKADSTGSESRLHQLRVASRRLEALLDLLVRKKSRETAEGIIRELRSTRKATGPLRDSQVELVQLKKEYEKIPSLTNFVKATRDKASHELAKDSSNYALLNDLIKKLHLKESGEKTKSAIQDSTKKSLQKIQLSLATIDKIKPKQIHKLRIKTKNIRYREEMANLVFGLPDSNIRKLKLLQDKLGEIHDKTILLKKIDSYLQHNEPKRTSAKINYLRKHIQMCKRKELNQLKQLAEKQL